MCTAYPPLGRHSVEAGIAEEEEAEGGAEGGFAENSFAEGRVEGRIGDGVAEEGINKNEGLEKRVGKFGEEGAIRLSLMVSVSEAVAEAVAEAVVVEAIVTEEDAAGSSEGAPEGEEDNIQGNAEEPPDNTEGAAEDCEDKIPENEGEADSEADREADEDGDNKAADDEEGKAESAEGEAQNAAGAGDRVIGGDGVAEGNVVVGGDGVEDGSGNEAVAGLDHVVRAAGEIADEANEEGDGGSGDVREEGILEGIITDGGIAQCTAEKGVAQSMEEWVVREGAVEENIAAESVADGGGVEERVTLVGQEFVGEQIENCLHKLSSGFLQVTRIATDMSHCGNALLVACITHTHKY